MTATVCLLNTLVFNLENFTHYDVYILATKIDIEFYSHYLHVRNKNSKKINSLIQEAEKLGVLHKPLKALIQGEDLIQLGIKPSKEFSDLIAKAYEAQLHKKFSDKKSALLWVGTNLLV